MKQFDSIILDLGGVIINLDYNRTAKAFVDLGLSDFNEIYSKARQSHLFDDFEKGLLLPGDFRAELRKYLPAETTNDQIDQAWNAMLLDIPADRMAFLRQLGAKYRIFLLSNTNRIHVTEFTRMADEKFGKGAFESTFEKYYYSCMMGMRKPDEEIFNTVVSENQLSKENTLFIDDSPQHVQGARQAGLVADLLNVESGERIEEKFRLLL